MKPEIYICNTSEAPRKARARDLTFYLDEIRQKFHLEFDKLEAFCTDGDIHPPYSYQWRATTKIREGEDDPFEGLGGSPLQAIHKLWKEAKAGWDYQEEDEI
jgi:hypothetical protein